MGIFEIVSDSGRAAAPLLAAVIGTAATLVAIIGGLLVARVASMAQALEAARELVAEAERRVTAAQGEVDRVKEVDLIMDRDVWLNKAIPALVKNTGLGYSYLEGQCGKWKHDPDKLDPFIKDIRATITQARAEIETASAGDDLTETWDDFRGAHAFQMDSGVQTAVYEEVYCHAYESQEARRRGQAAVRLEQAMVRARTPDERADVERMQNQQAVMFAVRATRRSALNLATPEERRSVSLKLGDATGRLADAKEALERARGAVRVNEIPAYTWPAVGVLAYLGLVDVGGPLVLLAYEPTDIGVGWRILLVASLLLGIAALVYTLVKNLRSESRKPRKKTPKS